MVYTFQGTGVPAPMATLVMSTPASIDAISVLANPGIVTDAANDYLGFGLGFGNPPCVDARAFNALQFTIVGDLGSCTLEASLVPSEDSSVQFGPSGTCMLGASCTPPFSGPVGIGTTTTCFSAMGGGSPLATVDPAALIDVQWLLTPPSDPSALPCQVSITVSGVSFVQDPTCP
jgi:hypothetical protein